MAPTLRREAAPRDDLTAVVARARETAVRRAQSLVLQVDARGSWRLMPLNDTSIIGRGAAEPPAGAVRLRLTPLGVCFAEGAPPAGAWDALACARAAEGDRR